MTMTPLVCPMTMPSYAEILNFCRVLMFHSLQIHHIHTLNAPYTFIILISHDKDDIWKGLNGYSFIMHEQLSVGIRKKSVEWHIGPAEWQTGNVLGSP